MKRGFFSTIRRQKDRALSGTLLGLLDKRRLEWANQRWNRCFVFFYSKGVVHKEFVPPGQTVNAAFYVEVLKWLKTRVARVRPEIANTWVLHDDNAPSHPSLLVRVSGETNRGNAAPTSLQTRPGPPEFFLLPWLKSRLKGQYFGTVKNMQAAVMNALKEIPVQDFQASYDAWQNRWQRCIDAQGCYFEEY